MPEWVAAAAVVVGATLGVADRLGLGLRVRLAVGLGAVVKWKVNVGSGRTAGGLVRGVVGRGRGDRDRWGTGGSGVDGGTDREGLAGADSAGPLGAAVGSTDRGDGDGDGDGDGVTGVDDVGVTAPPWPGAVAAVAGLGGPGVVPPATAPWPRFGLVPTGRTLVLTGRKNAKAATTTEARTSSDSTEMTSAAGRDRCSPGACVTPEG